MGSKYSFILYEDKNAPKYFQIEKSRVKLLLLGFPTIALISVFILLISFTKDKVQSVTPQFASSSSDSLVGKLEVDKKVLEQELKTIKEENTELLKKLEGDPAKSTLSAPPLFKSVLNHADLTATSTIKIDTPTLTTLDGKEILKFNLVNSNVEMKISGHIFILKKYGDSVAIYPTNSFEESPLTGISYQKGETFNMARLRPVEAHFITTPKEIPASYYLILFTRTGDLLQKEKIALPN